MKFYYLYLKHYILLFVIFVFTILIICITRSGTVANACGRIHEMSDIPVGGSTREPMRQFTISPQTKKGKQNKLHSDDNKTMPPNKKHKKAQKNNNTNAILPSIIPKAAQKNRIKYNKLLNKKNVTTLPSLIPDSDNQKHIYLSDYFLHLSIGDTYKLGISFTSKQSAINNKNTVKNNAMIMDKVDKNIISCKLEGQNNKTNTDYVINTDEKKEEDIINIKNNCVIADKAGIAVMIFYLKSNPNIKTSCTVRVTE